MSLARRVADLEDYSGGVCSVCGHNPDGVVTYEITWETDPDAPGESSPPCLRCGNVSVEVIGWEDERSEGSQARYKELHGHHDVDVAPDVEGAAAQVPDYPPRWDEHRGEGGGE